VYVSLEKRRLRGSIFSVFSCRHNRDDRTRPLPEVYRRARDSAPGLQQGKFSLAIRKKKILTVKAVKHWNRLRRVVRRVFILRNLQNFSEREAEKFDLVLQRSLCSTGDWMIFKGYFKPNFFYDSVNYFDLKIHESTNLSDVTRSLKHVGLFLWGRSLHVNVNIFCSHCKRTKHIFTLLQKNSLQKFLYP